MAALAVPASAQVRIFVRVGPPPIRVERPGPPPEVGFVWIEGYWVPADRRHYRWQPGHWERPPYEGAHWHHGHYDHYDKGWCRREGHWDRYKHDNDDEDEDYEDYDRHDHDRRDHDRRENRQH